ncbi:MAG: ABC transporter permease [Candidatus Cohnella colombiensis]|uniref:ABC transporter permease n=1 Tax=Candidatus Cohnella colombiensis TaxID=3121368 RepID=A0AA95F061_9BACL|nr:MAG: ABC transporter permease [Cohnella sp.]
MSNIIWLVSKSFRNTFRKRANWIIYFGIPIAGILLSMMVYGNADSGKIRIGIVNHDGEHQLTQDTLQFIESLSNISITMTDEETLRSKIAINDLDSGLIIHEGFAQQMRAGQPQSLELVSAKGAQVTAFVKAMLEQYLSNVAAISTQTQADAATFDQIYAEYRQHNYGVTVESIKDTSQMKDVTNQALGFLIALMMFSALNLTGIIIKEKENRTFLRILSSPVSSRSYVLANVLLSLIILTLQIIVTLVLMRTVFEIDTGVPFVQMLLVMMLFAIAAIGLSLMIVAITRSSQGSNALANLIITPTCLITGCYIPTSVLPDVVQKVASFFPQRWTLEAINKLQQGESLGTIGINLAIIVSFAAAFSLIAIYRFNRNNDTRSFV